MYHFHVVDQNKSSGGYSTDTQMRAIPAEVFAPVVVLSQVVSRHPVEPQEDFDCGQGIITTQEQDVLNESDYVIESSLAQGMSKALSLIPEEQNSSLHPPLRVWDEELQVKSTSAFGNQLNVNTDLSSYLPHHQCDERIATQSNEEELSMLARVERMGLRSIETPQSPIDYDVISNSSSVVETYSDVEMSEESDCDSVILLDSSSAEDLEELFCAAEEAYPTMKQFGSNFAAVDSIRPGERFKLLTRITGLLPHQSRLENLLVAFCEECRHIWDYHNFIHSVGHPRNRPRESVDCEDEECDWGAINYLCSEKDHDRNMKMITELDNYNMDAIESDDRVVMDWSYSYICPMCTSRGIPEDLCILKPSFFFRLHTEMDTKCLHILASGRHAEYFLGTKADHVLRSPEIWQRAEQRIVKLLESQQPLTLALLRYEEKPEEIYLENTINVYASNHLLPW